jgi:hypothetical protein
MAFDCKSNSEARMQHLNQHQLARRWALSARTLERWRWLGLGPRFLKLGGRVVYRLEDIIEFETQRIRTQTAEDALIAVMDRG